jgi:ribosomal protein S8
MGIKEQILELLKSKGYITKLGIAEKTGSTNAGEYISRLRRSHIIECVMCINSVTGREYGIYVYKGKK